MEQKLTQLCNLDPMIDDIKVVARCISLWKSHPLGRPNEVWGLDMVFQDAQGNRVQATVKNKNINKFQLLIDDGACYQIGNFGVGNNSKNPLLTHKYKINFFKNTTVTRVGDFDNNPRGFKFEPFRNFTARRFSESDIADVIGTVISMTDCIPFNSFGVDKVRRNMIIEDVEGMKLDCCFFDDWARKFDKLYEQRESLGHVVMILQLGKITYFNGKPSITNAISGSKLFVNDDIPEVAAFRQRYAVVEGYDPKQKIISLFTPVKREMTPKEFFQGAIKKMVGSIREAEKGFLCILYARIHKIHREHGWAYLACKKCGRISKEDEGGMKLWNCTEHKGIKESGVGIRYKVIISVTDDTGSASMLLFDDLVYQLSGVKCYDLLNEHGFEYDEYFPVELNKIVGKTLLFRFQYSDYNISRNHHVYQVQKLSEDQTMIDMFKQDFYVQGNGGDMHTPLMTGSSSKFSSSDVVPFNLEETPTSKGVASFGSESSGSGSGKRTIIDLDDYNEEEVEAKKGKMMVKVKTEPDEWAILAVINHLQYFENSVGICFSFMVVLNQLLV